MQISAPHAGEQPISEVTEPKVEGWANQWHILSHDQGMDLEKGEDQGPLMHLLSLLLWPQLFLISLPCAKHAQRHLGPHSLI